MNFALVTTTIYVPEVLRSYRALAPDVPFVIAGDQKSPHAEIDAFADEIGNCRYLLPPEQATAYPGLSEAIGWNCVQRRNIAVLEAMKTEPDVVVSIDDDNAPLGDYFKELEAAFALHEGTIATGNWFNLGDLAIEPYVYRGYPYSISPKADCARNGKPREIGVVNGLIEGDPDINATQRLESAPLVSAYDQSASEGIAVDPKTTWTPLNSQNTAWLAKLAPLMFVLPGVGRYDDIFGAYIAQRVLSATPYHVRFGAPVVHQDRNAHDLFKDLEDELLGMRHTDDLIASLEKIDLSSGSILDKLDTVLFDLREVDYLPQTFFDEWLAVWA